MTKFQSTNNDEKITQVHINSTRTPDTLSIRHSNPTKPVHFDAKKDFNKTTKPESRSLPTTPGSAGIISVGEIDYIIPKSKRLRSWSSRLPKEEIKPSLRFYSIGPSTHHIKCPLCKQRTDTETAQLTGVLGNASCLLSTLSCCFPIFTLSFVYFCLQSRLKSKRLFCNKCKGYLGYNVRPT